MTIHRIRPATKKDYSYVFDTWIESSRRAHDDISPKLWRQTMGDTVAISLRANKLAVACDVDDEDRLYGWACGEPGRILYVYVRGTMRRMGIGRALVLEVCGGSPTSAAWMTPVGQVPAAVHGIRWTPKAKAA